MNEEYLSVAMCTYNAENHIREQIDSILSQTRVPDEIVIVDDCSSDNTIRILEDIMNRYPDVIKLYRNDSNMGVTKNFEKAISKCQGSLIALSDQDDYWKQQKLEAQINYLINSNKKLCTHNCINVDEHRNPINNKWKSQKFKPEEINSKYEKFKMLTKLNFAQGSTLMFRADLRDYILPIPNVWIHDYYIALISVLISGIEIISEPLMEYRHHNNQVTSPRLHENESLYANINNYLESLENNQSFYPDKFLRWTKIREFILDNEDKLSFNKNLALPYVDSIINYQENRSKIYSQTNSYSKMKAVLSNLVSLYYFKHEYQVSDAVKKLLADTVYTLSNL